MGWREAINKYFDSNPSKAAAPIGVGLAKNYLLYERIPGTPFGNFLEYYNTHLASTNLFQLLNLHPISPNPYHQVIAAALTTAFAPFL